MHIEEKLFLKISIDTNQKQQHGIFNVMNSHQKERLESQPLHNKKYQNF